MIKCNNHILGNNIFFYKCLKKRSYPVADNDCKFPKMWVYKLCYTPTCTCVCEYTTKTSEACRHIHSYFLPWPLKPSVFNSAGFKYCMTS